MTPLKPTKLWDLLGLLAVTGVISWGLTRVLYGDLPPISSFAGASLYPVAALELIMGFVIRARVREHQIGDGPKQLHPITAARAVALAKASALLGAIAAGVWLGFLAWIFPRRVDLSAAAADVPGAVIGLVAAVLLMAAALWLEYCCRAPEDPGNDAAGNPGTP